MWALLLSLILICSHQGNSVEREETDEDDTLIHDFSRFLGKGLNNNAKPISDHEKDNNYWINNALRLVEQRAKIKHNTKIAKNVILFIGDGMGISTHTAARIYLGQLKNQSGEDNSLFFETFPYTGLSKTYCVDSQVADSACTSTAYTNGVKASIGTMGLNANVQLGDCKSSKNESSHTQSIVDWAISAGKSTGVVSTARITHASPGGAYAHIADRNWECDTDKPYYIDCQDIASQLIKSHPGNKINVLLGGGLSKFKLKNQGGKREDEDLLEAYASNRNKNNQTYKIVTKKQELYNISAKSTDYVLGLFADSHLHYELDKPKAGANEPTLTEMTTKAIEILSKNKNGFYLFVEGAKIDLAHHANKARKSLTETIEFDNAIRAAFKMTNSEETLIVVTADHSHTFTIAGYPDRGNDVLGKTKFGGNDLLGLDKLPYLTLGYNNGPGYRPPDSNGYRHNVNRDNTGDAEYAYPNGIPLDYETHGGEDVAVFSSGPWSHLLVGNYEQNYIPLVMSYAARIGPGQSVPIVSKATSMSTNGALSTIVFSVLTILVCKLIANE